MRFVSEPPQLAGGQGTFRKNGPVPRSKQIQQIGLGGNNNMATEKVNNISGAS
jgi:hypothetical protein